MRHFIQILLLCIVLIEGAAGQVMFDKLIWPEGVTGSGGLRSVIQLADEGYILGGMTGGSSGGMYSIQTNSQLTPLWAYSYHTPGYAYLLRAALPCSNASLFLTGETKAFIWPFSVDKALFIKVDHSNQLQWAKVMDRSPQATPLLDTKLQTDGGSLSLVASSPYAVLLRMDSEGDTVWTRAYAKASGGTFITNYVTNTLQDGGNLVTGSEPQTIIAYKVDEEGHLVWSSRYLFEDISKATGLASLDDGGIVMTAGVSGPSGSASHYPVIIKLDAEGDVSWSLRLPVQSGASTSGNRPVFAQRNGFMTRIGSMNYRFANDGSLLWVREIEGPSFSQLPSPETLDSLIFVRAGWRITRTAFDGSTGKCPSEFSMAEVEPITVVRDTITIVESNLWLNFTDVTDQTIVEEVTMLDSTICYLDCGLLRPGVTVTGEDEGMANGTATVTVSGGSPPFSFSWSSGYTGTTATGLTAGSYTVTVTDADGCMQTDTAEVPLLTGIPEQGLSVGLCHPSPAHDVLRFPGALAGDRACLYAVTGAEVVCHPFSHGSGMDVSSLPIGMYVAVLERGGRALGRQRVVVGR